MYVSTENFACRSPSSGVLTTRRPERLVKLMAASAVVVPAMSLNFTVYTLSFSASCALTGMRTTTPSCSTICVPPSRLTLSTLSSCAA